MWCGIYFTKEWTPRLFRLKIWKNPLEQEMVTYSSILAWKFCGWRSLVGNSSCGHKELDMIKHTHTHTHTCDRRLLLGFWWILEFWKCMCALETFDFMCLVWWIILKMQGLYVWIISTVRGSKSKGLYRNFLKKYLGSGTVWAILVTKLWQWKNYISFQS